MAKTTWIQVSASSRLTVGPIPVRSRNRFIFDKLKNNPEINLKQLEKITERQRHLTKTMIKRQKKKMTTMTITTKTTTGKTMKKITSTYRCYLGFYLNQMTIISFIWNPTCHRCWPGFVDSVVDKNCRILHIMRALQNSCNRNWSLHHKLDDLSSFLLLLVL